MVIVLFFPVGVMDEYWRLPVDEYRIAVYKFVRERISLIVYGMWGFILCNDGIVGVGKGMLYNFFSCFVQFI